MQHERRRDRFELAVLVAGMLYPTVLTWAYFVALAERPAGLQQSVYLVGKLLQFGLPAVWVVAIRREPLRWSWPTGSGLGIGLGFGAAVLAAMLGIYFGWLNQQAWTQQAAEAVRQKLVQLNLDRVAPYAALGLFYSLGHSLLEEYYWRWFVFGRLRRFVRVAAAVGASSLAFTAHHVLLLGVYFGYHSPVTYLFALAIAVGGAVWALMYHTSRSLAGPWLSHLLVDAGVFVIGFDLAWGWA